MVPQWSQKSCCTFPGLETSSDLAPSPAVHRPWVMARLSMAVSVGPWVPEQRVGVPGDLQGLPGWYLVRWLELGFREADGTRNGGPLGKRKRVCLPQALWKLENPMKPRGVARVGSGPGGWEGSLGAVSTQMASDGGQRTGVVR